MFPYWNLLYIEGGMSQNNSVVIRPARILAGSVRLPGDKSISHRYAMLAGIAEGETRLENYSTGADCASTLGCLRSLNVSWQCTDPASNTIEIEGRGPLLGEPAGPLDCGNSGS